MTGIGEPIEAQLSGWPFDTVRESALKVVYIAVFLSILYITTVLGNGDGNKRMDRKVLGPLTRPMAPFAERSAG